MTRVVNSAASQRAAVNQANATGALPRRNNPWYRRAWLGTPALWRWLIKTPPRRALVLSALTVVIAFFSATAVVEITRSEHVHWELASRSLSLKILIVATTFYSVIQRAAYALDVEIEKFRDKEFCLAYVRNRNLVALTSFYDDAVLRGDATAMRFAQSQIKITMDLR